MEMQDLNKRFAADRDLEYYQLSCRDEIRNYAHGLAGEIVDKTPASREQSLAITKIEEAVMWANAAIARNE